MQSRTIQLSILISAAILVLSVFSTKEGKYHLPFDIKYHTLSKSMQKQVDCLTENILFEAGHESKQGQVAVALVTLNRLSSGNYASDICGVVKQKTNGVCQFSWVCEEHNRSKRLTMIDGSLYNEIRSVAINVIMNYETMKDITKGATFYHADYVSPNWGLPKTTQIGRHIFYKRQIDIERIDKEIRI
jgi:spore germination cell wall hydrolase CwlJ-like protein